ncbi:hypothetical protein ANN_00766 [Periplaneta americana]|uniref:Uncharacterized protein n=1 Tax=Periplaneta americana TaxID=6978 RepID=A0ABQ8TRP6_PERAM|nr:hypothetical protein ANN_00766 [Periplaneta americana]
MCRLMKIPMQLKKQGISTDSQSMYGQAFFAIDKGPYVLPQRLTEARYQDFLITVLPTLLEYVPCQQRLQTWFMPDGTPAHFFSAISYHHLTLREEHRLSVFENKVLRKIFGAKRDEVTGEWRKLHNTELHALYSSPDIIRNIKSRRLRWAEHVARMGESRNAYRVLVGRLEGKRPLRRPRRRWEDNIKMDLREVEYDDRDWINLAQDRDR